MQKHKQAADSTNLPLASTDTNKVMPIFPVGNADQRLVVRPNFIIYTTPGLIKQTNEDAISYSSTDSFTRACLADGHWGSDAARIAVASWIQEEVFPSNIDEAIVKMKALEQHLYDAFGSQDMNAYTDFTPETAFIAFELVSNSLKVVSYGDCRLLVIREGGIILANKPQPTWLGAFSYLGLRQRQSVPSAIEFVHFDVIPGDTILLFSDGVDECIYGKATISQETLVNIVAASEDASLIVDNIMKLVIQFGAEDNASLVSLRV